LCGSEAWSLTKVEGLREWSAGEDIWALDGRGNRGVEKTTLRRALWSVLFTKYHSGDQIKKNEMGRACGTCERQGMGVQGFGGRTRGKKTLGRPRHRGGKLLKWIFKNWDE